MRRQLLLQGTRQAIRRRCRSGFSRDSIQDTALRSRCPHPKRSLIRRQCRSLSLRACAALRRAAQRSSWSHVWPAWGSADIRVKMTHKLGFHSLHQ
jgi:hypothetical protein